jgi:arsenate reductase (glutaredoxin)
MMRAITLYGIANCDTVKKSRAWLQAKGHDASFHDSKKAGMTVDRLDAWLAAVGWEKLLNRKGTTWRGLDDAVRMSVVDAESARRVMLANASVVKRPVVEWADGAITVGFDADDWSRR